ncbi:MAG: hypothetical protein LIR50_05570 [Bacillota bacterium]|nr:hypothetical protein [Bacillota bacterium]
MNLERKDSEEYTTKELKLLSDLMLGKQIKQEYSTLCNKCHKQIEVNILNPHNDRELMLAIKKYKYELPMMEYYKFNDPWGGFEYLRNEYEKGNISLTGLMYQSAQLEILNRGLIENNVPKKELDKIRDIINSNRCHEAK